MVALKLIFHKIFLDQNRFLPYLSYAYSKYLIACFFIAVRQDVNNLESSYCRTRAVQIWMQVATK